MLYGICEDNFIKFERKINPILKKCEKYGVDFGYKIIGEEFRVIDNEYIKFVIVEVSGEVKFNDWMFIASLESTDKGNIIRGYGEKVLEYYRNCKLTCDHCGTNRRRKYAYLIKNLITGEYKLVGKSCLKLYTDGLSAEMVAAYMDGMSVLEENHNEFSSVPTNHKVYVNTKRYLTYVAETVRCFGYVKKNNECYETPTCYEALDFMDADSGHNRRCNKYTKERLEDLVNNRNFDPESRESFVDDAISWIAQQDTTNEYMHNLKILIANEYTEVKNVGYVASLIVTYNKHLEKTEKKEKERFIKSKSEFVGEIKERITIDIDSFKVLTGWETDYGYTLMYEIVSKNNIFIWKTSKYIPDNAKSLIGTVKAHNEFRGIKQTELTRCRIME